MTIGLFVVSFDGFVLCTFVYIEKGVNEFEYYLPNEMNLSATCNLLHLLQVKGKVALHFEFKQTEIKAPLVIHEFPGAVKHKECDH